MNRKEVVGRILRNVDSSREVIVRFLQDLISFPSVSGNERDLQLYIASKLREWGISYDMWEVDESELRGNPFFETPAIPYRGRPMLVGSVKGVGGGKSLAFNGHVDVIPPGPREAWRHDPFSGFIEDDRLYGRGASDMKSGVAAYTMAVKILLDSGFRPMGNIYMHYVIDEEYTSNGTLSALLRGYGADGAVNAEASDLEVQPSVSGSMWFTVEVPGRTASMSRIWEGVNAIEKGCKVCEAIRRLYEVRVSSKKHPLYPDARGVLALFLGVFNSGTFPSAVPDKAVLKGRMGLLPGESVSTAINELRDFIHEYLKDDEWLKNNPPVVRQEGYAGEGVEIPVNHPLTQSLAKSFEAALGMKPVIKGHEGASDMRTLVRMGVPTVCFGPGTVAQMHAVNEWVNVEDLIKAVKVMAVHIVEWSGVEYVGK